MSVLIVLIASRSVLVSMSCALSESHVDVCGLWSWLLPGTVSMFGGCAATRSHIDLMAFAATQGHGDVWVHSLTVALFVLISVAHVATKCRSVVHGLRQESF